MSSNQAPIVDRIRIIPRPTDFLNRNVGSSGEVFFSKDTNSLRVFSGKDRGGFELAKSDLSNIPSTGIDLPNVQKNKIRFHWDTLADLQTEVDPSTYHGMIAHVHSEGRLYFAHSGQWVAVANFLELGSGGGGGTSVDVSETVPDTPESGNLWLDTTTGKLYIYIDDGDTSQWIQPTASSGGGSGSSTNALTLGGQPGSYYLDFNNFTNVPANQNVPTTILDLGINDGSNGQVLTTDGAGNFSFTTVTGGGGGVDLTAFSVGTDDPASGTGGLAYNNTSGVFTYTPPDLSSYLTSYTETDTLASVTGRGATTNTALTINNTLTVDSIITTNTGTPEINSATSFSVTAPDGMTVNGVSLPVAQGKIVDNGGIWSYTGNGTLGITFTRNGARDYTLTFNVAFGDVNDYHVVATQQGDANTVTSVNTYTITKNVGNVRLVFGGTLEPTVFLQIYEV